MSIGPATVPPDCKVDHAIELMESRAISSLLVVNEARVVGVFKSRLFFGGSDCLDKPSNAA